MDLWTRAVNHVNGCIIVTCRLCESGDVAVDQRRPTGMLAAALRNQLRQRTSLADRVPGGPPLVFSFFKPM